jgi:D-serine deaminase-like pyridoxal phosphate-dependent protein
MQQPQPGAALDTLDTPALLVDLAGMEANIVRLMQRLPAVGVRPHLKTAKSPVLARIFLAAGAVGCCVAKVSEAEVMVEGGIEDLLITTEIVGAPKLARLVRLRAQTPRLKVVVDSLAGARALNQAMHDAGLHQDVLLDLNVGQNRCGVLPGAPALELAHALRALSHLHLIGVQGYEGHLQHLPEARERELRCRQAMHLLTTTADQLRAAGFAVETVTTGGTGTAEICAAYAGVTEVQPGSFVFMDTQYRHAIGPVYAHALTVLATVISRPQAGQAVIDAGLKSLSTDSGLPELKGCPQVSYRPGGDEHGLLTWAEGTLPAGVCLEVGERVELFPGHIDTTVNLHDWYYAQREGKLEAIWPVAARGRVQ